MREIKFRAWDKENNVMITISDVDFEAGCSYFTDDRYIIMQSTGSLDKNGVAICEGDIVTTGPNEWEGNYEIAFCEKQLLFGMKTRNGNIASMSFWIDNPYKKLEIIGNIYENEDLLSSEK